MVPGWGPVSSCAVWEFAGPSSTTILVGAGGAAAGSGGRGLQAGNLGVLGAYRLQQPGAQFGPAVLQPSAGIFQVAGIGLGAGQGRRLGHPEQHVIESIQIRKTAKLVTVRPDWPLPGQRALAGWHSGPAAWSQHPVVMAERVAADAFQWLMLRLPMAVCTLASAGRRLAMANPAGAGAGAVPAAGAAAWAAAAGAPVKEPLHRSRVRQRIWRNEGS